MSKYRSPEHTILDMYEASIIGGRKTGSRGLAFRKSSTSKPDDWHDKRGTDVGASRNYANQQASYNKEVESEKNKEKEVDKRTKEAEQRKKETMNMAKEELEEAKIKGSRMPGRSLLDDPRVKKALMVQKALQGKSSLAPKEPEKKEVTKEEAEASGTVERRKIKNVARPDDSDPTSSKSKLSKQAEIKNKVIDEGKMLKSDNKFGISDSIIEAAKAIMNGKTEVDTKPETNDRDNDNDNDVDESKKKGKKKLDPVGKEDDDIDNDGDVDSSDKYLHARRKAIKKAMKEDVEQIDELKKSTLGSYVKKASRDVTAAGVEGGAAQALGDRDTEMDASKKIVKRIKGIDTATKKLTKEDIDDLTEEQLEEVLKKSDPAGKWISDFVHSKDPKFAGKSKKERMKQALGAYYAAQRNEEIEFSADEIARLEEIAKKFD